MPQKLVSHKKAQKTQNDSPQLFCAFCAFLWLKLVSSFVLFVANVGW
jgi:hypothetical protein